MQATSATSCTACLPGTYSAPGTADCKQCTVGNYCPGASNLIPCEVGTYNALQSQTSATSCLTCPVGMYSTGGASTCLYCTLGCYCPGGSDQIRCPAGTFSLTPVATTAAACVVCPSGKFSSQAASSCDVCPLGYYCPGGSNKIACPDGWFSTAMGASTSDVCEPCPSGKSNSLSMGFLLSLFSCTTCGPGTYCPGGSLSVDCPAGRYSSTVGATSVDSCLSCPPGKYTRSNSASICLDCPVGYFCPGNTDKLPCGAGLYSATTLATTSTVCTACAAGTTSYNGNYACSSCQPGQYCPGGGVAGTNCAPGYYTSNAGSISCSVCGAGTYSAGGAVMCFTCTPGYYCPGASNRIACAEGKFGTSSSATAESSACSPCPIGKYSSVGSIGCAVCPSGSYCAGGVAMTPCPVGKFSVTGGNSAATCTACPSGKFSTSLDNRGAVLCPTCPSGYYCPGDSDKVPFPVGRYSVSTGLTSAAVYQVCAAGTYVTPGGVVCVACVPGFYCPVESDPISCATGKFSITAGASTIDTCTDCPIGKYQNSIGQPVCINCNSSMTSLPGATFCISFPSSQPSSSPTRLPTRQPTGQPSSRPSSQPSSRPTNQPSCQPSSQPSGQPLSRPSAQPSCQPVSRPSTQPSSLPSSQPTSQPLSKPSGQPSRQPSSLPSAQPTSHPSRRPTTQPSSKPSGQPSSQPSSLPSGQPSSLPSRQPSTQPSAWPSGQPTQQPTEQPSSQPSSQPSRMPSIQPSRSPTTQPSSNPSGRPSQQPSAQPSCQPSNSPTNCPSSQPSGRPSAQPTQQPQSKPSKMPTTHPSSEPTAQPQGRPSSQPSGVPSNRPSSQPTCQPSRQPTTQPSGSPTVQPTCQPSYIPSSQPTSVPSSQPSFTPSSQPTQRPSTQPSVSPTTQPSSGPSGQPSTQPSTGPTSQPSNRPSSGPTNQPSSDPSENPSKQPSGEPSSQPSSMPTLSPSSQPTSQPSSRPTIQPSVVPSTCPSSQPTMLPSNQPTSDPTIQPSSQPTRCPSTQPSVEPSTQPTSPPSSCPTSQPFSCPSIQPSSTPTSQPSCIPSLQPSHQPSLQPTSQPTLSPTKQPTSVPSHQPSSRPSSQPTGQPTQQPNIQTAKNLFGETGESLSVWYNNSLGLVPNRRSFRIVLPFLYSREVSGGELNDIYLSGPTTGTNYIYSGKFLNNTDLRAEHVLLLSPAVSYDYSGRSVSNAGDINGDGYDDLIIGVPFAAKCFVLFGTAQGFLNMKFGFVLYGKFGDLTGWSVSGAGDVNNDTFADILIGAPHAENSQGITFVIYGKRSLYTDIVLSDLAPPQGFAVYGASVGDCNGVSVSNAGDVNGDGIDDIISGVLKSNSFFQGGAYIVFGAASAERLENKVYPESAAFATCFVVLGNPWSYTGYSVSGAGDVNNDQLSDVLIGSVPKRSSFGTQISYLIYGSRMSENIKLSTVTESQGVVISGGGVVVSGVGDIDNDGCDDILIGSNYGFNSGGGFVVFTDNLVRTTLPTTTPTIKPTTLHPTGRPSATTKPSNFPTIVPSQKPTVSQSEPTEPPTETPTNPTSIPSSVPSISTENPSSKPSSQPATSSPTSQPTSKPSERKSVAPTIYNANTRNPTTLKPTLVQYRPFYRTQLPTNTPQPSHSMQPTVKDDIINYFILVISKGGTVLRPDNSHVNYVLNTSDPVVISIKTGHNRVSRGDVYTILPIVNGSLTIEQFYNYTDIIDLSAHFSILSVSDITIKQGSIIITLPDTQQRIKILNFNPTDISIKNFIFYNPQQPYEMTLAVKVFITVGSVLASSFVILFISWVVYNRQVAYKKKIEHNKSCIIPLHENPTLVQLGIPNDKHNRKMIARLNEIRRREIMRQLLLKWSSDFSQDQDSHRTSESSSNAEYPDIYSENDSKSSENSHLNNSNNSIYNNSSFNNSNNSDDISSIVISSISSNISSINIRNSYNNSIIRSVDDQPISGFDFDNGSQGSDSDNNSCENNTSKNHRQHENNSEMEAELGEDDDNHSIKSDFPSYDSQLSSHNISYVNNENSCIDHNSNHSHNSHTIEHDSTKVGTGHNSQ